MNTCKIQIGLTMICLSLITLFSCSDDKPLVVDDFSVRVKNGYLEFKDQKEFESIKSSLKSNNIDYFTKWEAGLPGFTSDRKSVV